MIHEQDFKSVRKSLQQDTELVEGLKKGNKDCFTVLIKKYQSNVYNTALGFLQNSEDAEDLAQEVFIQVFQSVHSFKGDSKLSTWIYRITVRRSIDVLRSRKTQKRFASVKSLFGLNNELRFDSPDFNHPGVLMENRERAATLFKAINRLSDNQKAAFILHKLEGQRHQEIAEILKISVASVESLIFRAKTNLKKIIETHYKGIL
jgi:RNA polymerase sigma factor (sigma-70 family)